MVIKSWQKVYGLLGGVVLVLGVAVGSACVGDDPAPVTATERPVGDRGGSCFPNMTCNGGGLVCIDGFCLLPGDPVPTTDGGMDGGAMGEASTTDAQAEAASDGAVALCPPPAKHDAGVLQCNSPATPKCLPGNLNVCCTIKSDCEPIGQCAQTGGAHVCESKADCPAAQPECCLYSPAPVLAVDDAGCPSKIPGLNRTSCGAPGTCVQTNGTGVLCTTDSDCPDPLLWKCKTVQVELGSVASPQLTTAKMGICVRN